MGEGKVVVTNLTGCITLILWDASDIPTFFHISCGDEVEKTWQAIDKVGSRAKAYSTVASHEGRYKNAQKEIEDHAKSEGWAELEESKEELYITNFSGKMVWKLSATAGNRTITSAEYPKPNPAC